MHEQILEALGRGDLASALAAADAAIEADDNDARAHHLRAMAQRASGDTEAALASIDRAIALAPTDPTLHFQRASFLIDARQFDRARQDLARTVELDPNSLGAYLVQAELAIVGGDVDEAERHARAAERIAPDHPALAAVTGMVALRRGDPDRALSVLMAAQARGGEAPQLLNALGFAYMAKGHLAFAEQTFRRMRAAGMAGAPQQRLIAEIVHRQGRHQEALAELQPLLGEDAAPANMAFAGKLELAMQQPDRALPWLRRALAADPADPHTLNLIMAAWQQRGDLDEARNALDAALATSPQLPQLWQARAAVERGTLERERAVVARWLAAAPDTVAPLEAQLALLGPDDAGAAEDAARRILELQPGHLGAEARLLDLLARRDPPAAVRHAEQLQRLPGDERVKRLVRGWLAVANDAAGHQDEAVRLWTALHAELGERTIPPLEWSEPEAPRQPAAAVPDGAPEVVLLAGLPGAGVERLGQLLDVIVPAFRADRYGAQPPDDPLQKLPTIPALARGEADPGDIARDWRAQLPARGIADGAIIDWLLWWDNALLDVFAPNVPQARVLLALRDPRDMLLNWLAFGEPLPVRMGSPQQAAEWLARGLEHVAVLHERGTHAHRLLRTDEAINDPPAMAGPLGEALGLKLPVPPAGFFAARRFPAGHWRAYADVLAAPFAALTPVAVRLGYQAT
ncbi:tetratricopeptide repeat protein [Luteimonas sp. SJ-92]|uniref:Tetratricopeptide repeat protein n=1 Tax=Luteimonas salinisoli TaxID=2752307 RepID=A0A853JC00_9GAMM|nr:tetratricopeptide repeat protein [Luteimonas salinisoli]NZA26148.1 tetratricopeptide repeat protein [Luteimonas salinisoli]